MEAKSNPSQCSTSGRFRPSGRVLSSRSFGLVMSLIDVSVPLDANVPTYPGNTPFTIEAMMRTGRGDHANVSTLHMSAHSGTHVDAPWHSLNDGARTESLALDILVGP